MPGCISPCTANVFNQPKGVTRRLRLDPITKAAVSRLEALRAMVAAELSRAGEVGLWPDQCTARTKNRINDLGVRWPGRGSAGA
jgi:hypothetical protein